MYDIYAYDEVAASVPVLFLVVFAVSGPGTMLTASSVNLQQVRWRQRRVPVRVNLSAHGLRNVNEFIAMCFRNNFTPHYCSWLMMLSFFPLSNLHTDDSTCGIAGYSSQESPDNYLHQNSPNSSAPLSATRFLIQRSTNKCNYFRNDSNCTAPPSWRLCQIASRQKEWKMMHLEPCQKLMEPIYSSGFKHEQTFN